MPASQQRIMVVAGEASGDAHMAKCVAAFQKNNVECDWFGIGGDALANAGVRLLHHYKEINVMGFVEVLRHYPKIRRVFKTCKQALKAQQPDLLVLVDYPGFNLRLAKEAYALGIPVLYFIAPKIWASRAKRLQAIQKYVSHVAVIFPFEVALYQKENIPVSYVGNPLCQSACLNQSVSQARKNLNIASPIVIGLFPGSRAGEVSRILPVQVQAAACLLAQFPAMHFILPLAKHLPDVTGILAPIAEHITVVKATDMHLAARASDVAVVASGTATLEVAMLKTPQVVVYKMSGLSFAIAKRIVTIGRVSLVNIVAEKEVVKELLQAACNAESISNAVSELLSNPNKNMKMLQAYDEIVHRLGEVDTAAAMSKLMLKMLRK